MDTSQPRYTNTTREMGKKVKAPAKGERNIPDFLAEAKRRMKLAIQAESKMRDSSLQDMKFLVGDQWDANVKQDRINRKKPCLTVNRLGSIKQQIVNEQRAQRPQTVVNPVGSDADVDIAAGLTGLFRHIEVNSDAELADDTAFEQMVAGGKGYSEICLDYIPGQHNFQQDFYVKPVKNRFTVYCDPSSISPTEEDANWKFQVEDIPHDEYRLRYPDTQLASLADFKSVGNTNPGWADSETVRVAKYWYKDVKMKELCLLGDGSISFAEDVPPGKTIIRRRKDPITTIRCSVINAVEEIDQYVWPGRIGYIPLIPCIGEDYDVDGERYQYGIVRNAKDPQKSYNIFKTAAAEMVAKAPTAPWVGWEGQMKDPKWGTSNTVDHAYLEARVSDPAGKPYPSLPQRITAEPPIQAMTVMVAGADQDLKATTGIYEPSLGASKTDQSGAAIQRLQQQAGLTNLNYTDNLKRYKRAIARCILDAMPFVYDAPRIQRILKPDGTFQQVIFHSQRELAAQALVSKEVTKVFDIGVGTYDVVINVGPSYDTQRQQAWAQQTAMVQAYPKLLDIAGDIVIGNADIPGAREISNRIKKTIPPALLEDDGDPNVKIAQLTSQLLQLTKAHQALTAQAGQMEAERMSRKIENDARVNIAKMNAAKDVLVAQISKATTVGAATIKAGMEADKEFMLQIGQHAHEIGMQAMQLASQPAPEDEAGGDLSEGAGGGNPAPAPQEGT